MGLALDELDKVNEKIITREGIDIVCDERARLYLDHYPNVYIDYIDEGYGSGFIVNTGGRYGMECC